MCSQQFRADGRVLSTGSGNHLCGGRCSNESTCGRGALALEALPAKHGPPLGRLERNSCFNAARRTFGARLCTRKSSRSRPCARLEGGAGAFGLARLTAFRVVLELFVEEKELFPGGEDELTTTICAG